MFGVHDIELFSQLAMMVRSGHLIDANGDDIYTPNLSRPNLPIGFIHGTENRCYLPMSTEKIYHLLVQRFDAQQYERHRVQGYGHPDCVSGKNATLDVFRWSPAI